MFSMPILHEVTGVQALPEANQDLPVTMLENSLMVCVLQAPRFSGITFRKLDVNTLRIRGNPSISTWPFLEFPSTGPINSYEVNLYSTDSNWVNTQIINHTGPEPDGSYIIINDSSGPQLARPTGQSSGDRQHITVESHLSGGQFSVGVIGVTGAYPSILMYSVIEAA